MDLIKVADALIEMIKKNFPDDISIVALCGSYVYNDIHDKSDLDFYFIPKTERGYKATKTFIIGDTSFDFWGLSWERATSMAEYNEENVSIIVGGKVIYYNSDEDLERFHMLQNGVKSISKEEFHKKAIFHLNKSNEVYFNMLTNDNNLHKVKSGAIYVLRILSFSIALFNCTSVRRGWGKLLSEICNMSLIPDDFAELYETILISNNCNDLINKTKQIIINTRKLIEKQSDIPKIAVFTDVFYGFYEEAKSIYNKICHACEINDYHTAVLATSSLENLINDCLDATGTDRSYFPNLLTSINVNNLGEFIKTLKAHEECFVNVLIKNNLDLQIYKNFEEFQKDIER